MTTSPLRASAVLVAAVACAAFGARAQEPQWTAAAVEAIEALIRRDGVPGLSCAVAVGDALVLRLGFGLADVENDVPATPQTVYRLASISKPVTAVMALQLAEAGALDLDADVATVVAEWPRKDWPVTTRQLLGHLGGVRHYRGEAESVEAFATQRAGLPRFAADPLVHEPGTRYLYSTYGYNLVGAVLEARSGEAFAALVRARIAEPCGAATLQADDSRRLIRGRAQGYVRVAGVLRNSTPMDSSYKIAGGGLCSSAEDLARFAQALLAGRLLPQARLTAMWTEQTTKDGSGTGYGLGFTVARKDGAQLASHSGAQARVSTMLVLRPVDKVAVAVLCNLEGCKLAPLAERLAALAAGEAGK